MALQRQTCASNEDQCDVLVIGAGPAGSTAAALIAGHGKNVVLLEKNAHPRFHIGESLLPKNLAILQRLGVLDEIATEGVLKPGAEFVSDETGVSVQFNFADGLNKADTHSYQVIRANFDQTLFSNAKRRGARTFEETRVTDVVLSTGASRASVQARSADGRILTFAPRFIIDASGREAFLASKLRLIRTNKRESTAAAFAHFRNVRPQTSDTAGYITVHLAKEGWFWMIPLSNAVTSVGFVGSQAVFKNRRGALKDFLLAKIQDSPSVRKRMMNASLVSEVTGAGNYAYCARSACGDGYLIIGDAFAFVDPIFSTGVLLAMTGAELAADIAIGWLDDPKVGLALARQAERRMRASIHKLSWFIHRINDPVLRDMFMAPSNRFRMRAGIVTLLAGNLQKSWRYMPPLVAFKCMFYVLSVAHWAGFRLPAPATADATHE